MSKLPKHKFEALDGMRGLLALCVALIHIRVTWHFFGQPPMIYAYLAVDFFFVLSGFVITHANGAELTTPRSGASFMIRRFGRVWPLHAFVLACFASMELIKLFGSLAHGDGTGGAFQSARYSWQTLLSSLALVHSLYFYNPSPGGVWNMPSWSISTEFYTYLIFALVAIFLRKWFLLISITMVVFSTAALFILVPDMNTLYDYGIIRCVAGFFTGHLIYRLWKRSTSPLAFPLETELLAIGLMILFVMLTGDSKLSILAPMAFALTIYVLAFQAGPISKALCSWPIQLLGKLSYSIYIIHFFVLYCFNRGLYAAQKITGTPLYILHQGPHDAAPYDTISFGNVWVMDGLVLVFLALVITAAALATRFIERPAMRYFNNMAKRLQSKPTA